MARVKVRLADQIARVVFIETDATNGATLDTNLFMADGKTVATPALLRKYLGFSEDGGTMQHKLLGGLTLGDDHPQYTMWQARETIKGQWDFVSAIWGADGTAALPEFTFTGDVDTGLYRIGDNNFGLSTGGALRWDINTTRSFQTIPHIIEHANGTAGLTVRNPLKTYNSITIKTIDGAGDGSSEIGFWEQDPTHAVQFGFRIFMDGVPGTPPPYEAYLRFYRVDNNNHSQVWFMTRQSAGVDFVEQVRAMDGSAGTPSYAFTSDPDTGIYRAASNQIGLSTSGSQRFLLTNSALTGTVPIQLASGSAGSPSFSFSGDPNTGIFSNGADDLGFAAGGTLRMNISTTAVVHTLPIRGAAGTNAAPEYSFSSDTNTGMYSGGTGILSFATGGARRFGLGAAGEILDGAGGAGTAGQVPISGGSGAAWEWGDMTGGGGSGGLAYVNTSVPAGNTVANTASETAFTSSYTIPAGQLQPGSVVRLKLFGVFGTDTVAPTLRIRAKLGSTTVLDTTATTLTGALTNQGWAVDASMVCFTDGATGTLDAQGVAEFAISAADGQVVNMENTSTASIDTTGTLALTVTVQWGTADVDNTITLREMTVDLLDAVTPTTAAPAAATYLTGDDETAELPNSRQLLAGTNITFDDSTPGERTINASGGGGSNAGALLMLQSSSTAANEPGWNGGSGYTIALFFPGQFLLGAASSWTLRLTVATANMPFTAIVLRRTLRGSATYIDSTAISFAGDSSPTLTPGTHESDTISVAIDDSHDYYILGRIDPAVGATAAFEAAPNAYIRGFFQAGDQTAAATFTGYTSDTAYGKPEIRSV